MLYAFYLFSPTLIVLRQWCCIPNLQLFVGASSAVPVLGQLHFRVISSRIQHAWLCPIVDCCFCYFLGEIYTFSFKEALGMYESICQILFLAQTCCSLLLDMEFGLSFLVQNSTLRHYTNYRACDLCDCVKVLHHLCCNGSGSNLAAVREKYCQHKVLRFSLSLSLSSLTIM